jgi:hypothetical protein
MVKFLGCSGRCRSSAFHLAQSSRSGGETSLEPKTEETQCASSGGVFIGTMHLRDFPCLLRLGRTRSGSR